MYRFTAREILISILVMLAVAGVYYVRSHPPGCGPQRHCGVLAAE